MELKLRRKRDKDKVEVLSLVQELVQNDSRKNIEDKESEIKSFR